MTREELIERGANARALLDNETFQTVVADLFKSFEVRLFATHPDDGKERNNLYHQHVALQSIVGTLKHWAAMGEVALAEVESEDDEDDS